MSHHTDPDALLDELDPDALQARLDDLHRQLDALHILLRAARVRRRKRGKPAAHTTPPKTSVVNAHLVGRPQEGGGR